MVNNRHTTTPQMQGMIKQINNDATEDELSIINVISIKILQEAAQVQDLTQAVSVSLHGKNIAKIEALELCPNLRTLDLSFNHIRKLEGLSCLSKLRELRIYDNHISNLEHLVGLTNLHTLDVSGNKLYSLQGVSCLRSLKILRCAHNPALSSLEGLGRAGGLETLDVSHCCLPDLTALTAAVRLKELIADGNKISNLRGIQRCDQLEDLRLADNRLTSLQGLKSCANTLDVLDVRDNALSSLEGLTEGLICLHELYLNNNKLTSLAGLAEKAPSLETLDISHNKVSLTPTDLATQLSCLTDLTWLGLEGNPVSQCPGYQADVLHALPQLEGVDAVNRPEQVQPADVWVNPADAAPDDPELRQLLTDVDPATLLPTVDEIERYKQAMNINSNLPVVGIASQSQPQSQHETASSGAHGDDATSRNSVSGSERLKGVSQRPGTGTGSTRPGSSSTSLRPGTASMNPHRPGTASSTSCNAALLSRPGSARVMGLMGSPVVKDVLMHQKPLSSRTGGGVRLMTPEQYADAVSDFGSTMQQYSSSLRTALTTIKAGLQMNLTDAAEQLRDPESSAARQLPSMPVLPVMPDHLVKDNVVGTTVANPLLFTNQQHMTVAQAMSMASAVATNTASAAAAAAAAAAAGGVDVHSQRRMRAPVDVAALREAMKDPDAPAVLEQYHRLYAQPGAIITAGAGKDSGISKQRHNGSSAAQPMDSNDDDDDDEKCGRREEDDDNDDDGMFSDEGDDFDKHDPATQASHQNTSQPSAGVGHHQSRAGHTRQSDDDDDDREELIVCQDSDDEDRKVDESTAMQDPVSQADATSSHVVHDTSPADDKRRNTAGSGLQPRLNMQHNSSHAHAAKKSILIAADSTQSVDPKHRHLSKDMTPPPASPSRPSLTLSSQKAIGPSNAPEPGSRPSSVASLASISSSSSSSMSPAKAGALKTKLSGHHVIRNSSAVSKATARVLASLDAQFQGSGKQVSLSKGGSAGAGAGEPGAAVTRSPGKGVATGKMSVKARLPAGLKD